MDQFSVARQVARLGAGKRLSRWRVNAQRLRRLAHEVLANPAFARASAEIGQALREAGGYKRAADEIERFRVLNRSQLIY